MIGKADHARQEAQMMRPRADGVQSLGAPGQMVTADAARVARITPEPVLKVLVVSMNYAPEMIAIGLYSTDLAEHLSRRGIKVDVIAAKPYYPEWRPFQGWRGPFWRSRTGDGGERIVHCPLYVPRNPRGGRRILHYLSFTLSALPVLVWRSLVDRPDIVFAVAPSLMAARAARICARLCGARTWLHVQDFEVEAAIATGLLKRNRLARLALAFERRVLRSFDRVSTISHPMRDRLIAKGIAPGRTYELRNWAHADIVRPSADPAALRAQFGITTPHVVLYSGNLANKQGLELIPEIADHLAHRSDITFVICGEGPMKKVLESRIDGMGNVQMFPLIPLAQLGDLLGMADVHLLPQIAGAADLVLPSKLTNMLASGRPVLATAALGTALAHEVLGAGVLTPPGDAKAAAEALEALIDDPEKRRVLGEEARLRANERWNRDQILRQLTSEFERLDSQDRTA